MQPQPIYHERLSYSREQLTVMFGIGAMFGLLASSFEVVKGVLAGYSESNALLDWRLLASGFAMGIGSVLLVMWFSRRASIAVDASAITVTSGGNRMEYSWHAIRRYSRTHMRVPGGSTVLNAAAAVTGAHTPHLGHRVVRPGGDTVSAADPVGGFHGGDGSGVLIEFVAGEKPRFLTTNQPDQLMAALRAIAPEKEWRPGEVAPSA